MEVIDTKYIIIATIPCNQKKGHACSEYVLFFVFKNQTNMGFQTNQCNSCTIAGVSPSYIVKIVILLQII